MFVHTTNETNVEVYKILYAVTTSSTLAPDTARSQRPR